MAISISVPFKFTICLIKVPVHKRRRSSSCFESDGEPLPRDCHIVFCMQVNLRVISRSILKLAIHGRLVFNTILLFLLLLTSGNVARKSILHLMEMVQYRTVRLFRMISYHTSAWETSMMNSLLSMYR